MGIIIAPLWLFNFVVVFGWFVIASIAGLYISAKYGDKIIAIVSIPVAAFLSWKITTYLLNKLIAELADQELFKLFSFTEITWRLDILYLGLAALIITALSFSVRKLSPKLFSCIMILAISVTISGATQSYIGLFQGNDFLESRGLHLSY